MDRYPAPAARARTRRAVFVILVAMLPIAAAAAAEPGGGPVAVETLVREALGRNPEICAARHEHEAAEQRAISSRALEDPQLELGVVNAPLPSFSLRREDMTMKMLGLSQRLPDGRALRNDHVPVLWV